MAIVKPIRKGKTHGEMKEMELIFRYVILKVFHGVLYLEINIKEGIECDHTNSVILNLNPDKNIIVYFYNSIKFASKNKI